MTDRARLADAIDPRKWEVFEPTSSLVTIPRSQLIAASDALRAPTPDQTALVQSLLATCDRLGMTNRPADAPAAFARVLGEFGAVRSLDSAEHGVDLYAQCVGCTEASEDANCWRLDDLRLAPDGKAYCDNCWDYVTDPGEWKDAPRLISRHIPSDRYGEGFAAGVAAAADMCLEQVEAQRNIVSSIKDRYEKQIGAATALGWREAGETIRGLTPHGDDHG